MNRSLIPLLCELEKVKYHKTLMCVCVRNRNRTELKKNKNENHWEKCERIQSSILSFFNEAESKDEDTSEEGKRKTYMWIFSKALALQCIVNIRSTKNADGK